MRLFGSERISGMVERLGLPQDMPIDAKILSGSIESAQKRIEDQNFKRRKYVLTYDDVMNQQRSVIYKQRQSVLDGDNITDSIQAMINQTIAEAVNEACAAEDHTTWELEALRDRYAGLLCNKDEFNYTPEELQKLQAEDILELLQTRAITLYHDKEKLFGEETFREIERAVLLRNVDTKWMDHIDEMDDLKGSIGLQAYAQRDPVNEYRLQGSDMFDAMIAEIREETVRRVLTVVPRPQPVQRVQIAKPLQEGMADGSKKKVVVVRKAEKIGRNDLCPCGSGKKYKKCCGAAGGQS